MIEKKIYFQRSLVISIYFLNQNRNNVSRYPSFCQALAVNRCMTKKIIFTIIYEQHGGNPCDTRF